ECTWCDGTGRDFFDQGEPCSACDEGWQDADYGYSCCYSAEELLEYMRVHGVVTDDDPVVIFEGHRVGTGGDGEPLAGPSGRIRWTTIGALRAGAAACAARTRWPGWQPPPRPGRRQPPSGRRRSWMPFSGGCRCGRSPLPPGCPTPQWR